MRTRSKFKYSIFLQNLSIATLFRIQSPVGSYLKGFVAFNAKNILAWKRKNLHQCPYSEIKFWGHLIMWHPNWNFRVRKQIATLQYNQFHRSNRITTIQFSWLSFLILGLEWTQGLPNPVLGPSRDILFRVASIFVVVDVWDTEVKVLRKFFCSCILHLSSLHDRPRRSLICVGKWKWPHTFRKVQNFNENLLFPICGFLDLFLTLQWKRSKLRETTCLLGTWYKVGQSQHLFRRSISKVAS